MAMINRVDQVAEMRRQYEQLIPADVFAREEDRAAAHRNLEMLKLYSLQQDLRKRILADNLGQLGGLPHHGIDSGEALDSRGRTLGDLLYSRQLLDRNFYRRTKTFQ